MVHKELLEKLDAKLDRLKRSKRKKDRRQYHVIEGELERLNR
jgi:hypothetical protein